jgi:3-dehydroquinate dehydratase / shikimate dehydrogenase
MANEHLFGADRVCGVVAARTAAEAWRQIRDARRYTTTIELRFDWLTGAGERRKLLALLEKRLRTPQINFIATCRRRNAGGKFRGSVAEQLSLLRSAIAAGCRWVDLEIETVESFPAFALDLYTARAKRILSFHNFRAMPPAAELARILRSMENLCANRGFEAIKIAIQCNSLREGLQLLALAREKQNVIAIPMGEICAPLRILALREGSALSYAPVEEATAPGQIRLAEMHDLYRAGSLTSKTRVFAVIGDPVAHSLSPALHNAGFRAGKVDAVYLPFRVTDLNDFLRAIPRLRMAGFSVTLPHKEKLLRSLERCHPLARTIGAVNTVAVRANGKLFGYNTDSLGVLRALKGKLRLPGSSVLILGAGGAARAVAFTLAREGARVFICSRTFARAQRLAREVKGEALERSAICGNSFDLIVNATPVGMHPRENESPIRASEMNCAVAFDLIYRPQQTKFLRLAAKKGIRTVSGVEMFLAQGIGQWELWTGRSAPVTVMRNVVLAALRPEKSELSK